VLLLVSFRDIPVARSLGKLQGKRFVNGSHAQGGFEPAAEIDGAALKPIVVGRADDDYGFIILSLGQAIGGSCDQSCIGITGVRGDKSDEVFSGSKGLFGILEKRVNLAREELWVVGVKPSSSYRFSYSLRPGKGG
jgi:hypothetical protein